MTRRHESRRGGEKICPAGAELIEFAEQFPTS